MADQKISELTALTGANVADDDAIAIVDTSATETKKIVFSELKNALDTATGFVRITGDTMTGNLSMGDNVKATFGAGSDLQIYHDGAHSYISDQGTGHLKVFAESFFLNNSGDTEQMIGATVNGAIDLFYNGSKKFETTSTGISVTGNATFADNGKAIFGAGSDLQIYHDGTRSYVDDTGAGSLWLRGGDVAIKSTASETMAEFANNGAVTLYYDNAAKIATTSTGIDVTGNANFADNGKAIFGAGSDLSIYHDGSHSYIHDAGDGDLYVRADDDLRLQVRNSDDDDWVNAVHLNSGGETAIHYNGSKKLATTSTGVDITGVLSSDGLTVNGSEGDITFGTGSNIKIDTGANGANPRLYFDHDNLTGGLYFIEADRGNQAMEFVTSSKLRLGIASNGDISFYEDTGTTAKMVWSASNERLGLAGSDYQFYIQQGSNQPWYNRAVSDGSYRLHLNGTGDIITASSSGSVGIGTSSPQGVLDLGASSSGRSLTFAKYNNIFGSYSEGSLNLTSNYYGDTTANAYKTSSTATYGAAGIEISGTGGTSTSGLIQFFVDAAASKTADAAFVPSERMRITSAGNVGIGTSSPSSELHLAVDSGAGSPTINLERTDTSVSSTNTIGNIIFTAGEDGSEETVAQISAAAEENFSSTSSATGLFFKTTAAGSTSSTEAMRIDSSGRVGIGNASPQRELHIGAADDTNHEGIIVLNNGGTTGYRAGIEWRYESNTAPRARIGVNASNQILEFDTAGTERMRITTDKVQFNVDAKVDADNSHDLGAGGARWKDLYLSGGVYLGGTGSANKLDDYEEGTWTPTAAQGITGLGVQSATYTKVGRIVTVMTYLSAMSGKDANALHIGGLPFTPASNNYSTGVVECSTSGQMGVCRTNSNNTYLVFYKPASDNTRTDLVGNDVGSSHIIFSITYQTT